jgi:hypothetical protein
MDYPNAESLNGSFAATYGLIKRHTEGLCHADSLVQPPFQANCLNWVVGHIVSGRNEALQYLGAETVWGEEELARYRTGSPPITKDEQALPFERLLADLDLSQERIVAALSQLAPEALDEVVETRFGARPVGQHIDGLSWHETYHTGQLELLRAVSVQSSPTRSDPSPEEPGGD